MRTLGFRAMWEDLNDSEGDTWCDTDQIEMSEFFQLLEDGKIDKNTLGQKTGLKDKNGVEIYEGDFIEESLYVGWCEKQGGFETYLPDDYCMGCNGDMQWYEVAEDAGKYEVIGNIYENPELLNHETSTNTN